MKNLLTAALATALLCSCGGASYTITGRYELPPGDSVYLRASDNTVLAAGIVDADTTGSIFVRRASLYFFLITESSSPITCSSLL